MANEASFSDQNPGEKYNLLVELVARLWTLFV
jgi:hypothetical protein